MAPNATTATRLLLLSFADRTNLKDRVIPMAYEESLSLPDQLLNTSGLAKELSDGHRFHIRTIESELTIVKHLVRHLPVQGDNPLLRL